MCALAIPVVLAGGCSRRVDKWVQRRPPTFRGSGTITCDGVSVGDALVTFDSLEHNLTAVGRTDTQGRFVLKTWVANDGAVAGEHRVKISKIEATGYDQEGYPLGFVNRLPDRYGEESSGLTATVQPKHGNIFNFDLSTAKPPSREKKN